MSTESPVKNFISFDTSDDDLETKIARAVRYFKQRRDGAAPTFIVMHPQDVPIPYPKKVQGVEVIVAQAGQVLPHHMLLGVGE